MVQQSDHFTLCVTVTNGSQLTFGVAMFADWLIDEDLPNGKLVALCPEYNCTATVFETAEWAFYANRTFRV
jgi:DNA-binding transcriptional LysR family regulator